MDAMFHALGGILLRAVPTFVLILLLHMYLKSVFFKPLGQVLKARYEATEGARKLAEQSLADAAEKTAKYEKALLEAKGQLYLAQEKAFKDLQDRQSEAIVAAWTDWQKLLAEQSEAEQQWQAEQGPGKVDTVPSPVHR